LTQDGENFKADKISLIYEFNNSSPLFVRVAQSSLMKMEVDYAIRILENGLALYPHYPSAYIIYGKALAIKGQTTKAIEMITKASRLINSSSTLDYYSGEIYKITAEFSNYNGSAGEDFVPEKLSDDNAPSEESPTIENRVKEKKKNSFHINLDKLTEEVSKAKMPRATGIIEIDENSNFEFDDNKIVSETLAGIYFAQGNYNEALELYKELKSQNPHRTEIFDQRILEIEELIKNKNL